MLVTDLIKAVKEGQEKSMTKPQQEFVAKPRLIGWRTANFLWETNDIEKAKKWERHQEILPIFEGDRDTHLTTPPQRKPLTDEEIEKISEPFWDGHLGYGYADFDSLGFARAIEVKLKEKNEKTN